MHGADMAWAESQSLLERESSFYPFSFLLHLPFQTPPPLLPSKLFVARDIRARVSSRWRRTMRKGNYNRVPNLHDADPIHYSQHFQSSGVITLGTHSADEAWLALQTNSVSRCGVVCSLSGHLTGCRREL